MSDAWAEAVTPRDPARFRVVRFFQRESVPSKTVKRHLTLAQAQEHCGSPHSDSRTATDRADRRETIVSGPWFDGYEEED